MKVLRNAPTSSYPVRDCSLTVEELRKLLLRVDVPGDAFVTFRIDGVNEMVKEVWLTERDPETGDIDLVFSG